MKMRSIKQGISWMGVIDWSRRLFDALVPTPDGTSYNAYLVEGSQKTALLDTSEPARREQWIPFLSSIERLDYLVSHHAEQDHSGLIPDVLEHFPDCVVLCSPKAKPMLIDHLGLPNNRIREVTDGETLELGGKTITFIHTPWVHWPETMVSYLKEDRILFSCDFFGAHQATADLFVTDREETIRAAKLYFAGIMLPYRKAIAKNLEKIRDLEIDIIAPSHGPVHDHPAWILEAYRDWISDHVRNVAVIAYVSTHGSLARMAETLAVSLADRGVTARLHDLTVVDVGRLAVDWMDAATFIMGASIMNGSPHPLARFAAACAEILKPRAKFGALLGSYGWSPRGLDSIGSMVPSFKGEDLGTVLCQGAPGEEEFKRLEELADLIAKKHEAL